jgi:hypothetical protein
MNLSFNNANIHPITSEFILSKISEFDIFKRYCTNFKEIDVSFFSDLRTTNTPNCRIFITFNNELKYRDFKLGETLNCWQYVMQKFNCNYFEALNIVSNDFNLKSGIIYVEPRVIAANDEFKLKIANNTPREKSIINIVSQPWNSVDFEYWNSYKIPLSLLDEYNVYSAKTVFLIKGTKRVIFDYKKVNPCYAYRFDSDTGYSYKIYWPLSKDKKFKWLFSGGSASDIEGYSQLPLHGDILILTKSLKDCMCYNLIGYPAISLQGEANKLEQSLVDKLLKRFDRIIVNYDEDEEGIRGSIRLKNQFEFDYFFIDEYKDLSEYIKNKSIEEAKIMINDKINELV